MNGQQQHGQGAGPGYGTIQPMQTQTLPGQRPGANPRQPGFQQQGYGYGLDALPPLQQEGAQETIPGQRQPQQLNGPQVMGYVPQQVQQHPQAPQQNGGGQPQGQPQGYNQMHNQQVQGQQPQGGYPNPQPQQQNQPQGQPQQGQQGQRFNMTDDTVLDGPGVPPELRGRKWGNVREVYTQMMSDAMRQRNAQSAGGGRQGQQAQQPQQPGQQGGYPTPGQPQGQGDQQVNERAFYERPISTMQETLRNIVREELGPVQQQTMESGINTARERAQQMIPDYQQLSDRIEQRLQQVKQVNPQALQNPQIWVDAARMVRGELAEQQMFGQGQQGGQQNGGQPQPQSQYGGQYTGGYSGYQPPQQNGPQPMGGYATPVNQFFTEGPTPPSGQQAGSLSPTDQWYARQLQMSDAEYSAWKSGVPQQNPGQQQYRGGF